MLLVLDRYLVPRGKRDYFSLGDWCGNCNSGFHSVSRTPQTNSDRIQTTYFERWIGDAALENCKIIPAASLTTFYRHDLCTALNDSAHCGSDIPHFARVNSQHSNLSLCTAYYSLVSTRLGMMSVGLEIPETRIKEDPQFMLSHVILPSVHIQPRIWSGVHCTYQKGWEFNHDSFSRLYLDEDKANFQLHGNTWLQRN